MEHSTTSNPGVNAALASQYNRRLLVCISPIVWRNLYWLDDDLRREDGVMTFTSGGVIYTNKYTETVNMDDACPLIRYAEVILNSAEAYTRLGGAANLTAGLNALNQVRDRSLANPATQSYTGATFANGDEHTAATLNESRI